MGLEKLTDWLYLTFNPDVVKLRLLARSLGGRVRYEPKLMDGSLCVDIPTTVAPTHTYSAFTDQIRESPYKNSFEPIELTPDRPGGLINQTEGDRHNIGMIDIYPSKTHLHASLSGGRGLIRYFNKALKKLAAQH